MKARRSLFQKYVIAFVAVIGGMLIARGLIELYMSYQENTAALMTLQKEKAGAAVVRIDHFIREIQNHIGWASHPYLAGQEATAEQRRFDFQWLLRQVEPITEVRFLDESGKEQLLISRLAVDAVGSQKDYSAESKFREAGVGGFHFGPLYFRNESEPYMTLAMRQGHGAGVTVAELNLKLIWDVVSQIRVGQHGYAYVVDPRGNLVAHPDISLVLQKTDFSRLPQVRTALRAWETRARSTPMPASAGIWTGSEALGRCDHSPSGMPVFVEQSVREAFSPVTTPFCARLCCWSSDSVWRLRLAQFWRAVCTQAYSCATVGGDEIGGRGAANTGLTCTRGMSWRFLPANSTTWPVSCTNRTNLEQKVEARTRELTEALRRLKALAKVSRAVNSTLDLETVLTTMRSAGRFSCRIRSAASSTSTMRSAAGSVPNRSSNGTRASSSRPVLEPPTEPAGCDRNVPGSGKPNACASAGYPP